MVNRESRKILFSDSEETFIFVLEYVSLEEPLTGFCSVVREGS